MSVGKVKFFLNFFNKDCVKAKFFHDFNKDCMGMSRIARVDSLGRFLTTMRCYGCMSSRSNVGFLGLCGVERKK